MVHTKTSKTFVCNQLFCVAACLWCFCAVDWLQEWRRHTGRSCSILWIWPQLTFSSSWLVIIILILSLHFDLCKDLQLFFEIWAKYKTCGITFPRLNCHSPPTYPGVFTVKYINLWDFQIKEITPACWLFDLQWAFLNSFPPDSILRYKCEFWLFDHDQNTSCIVDDKWTRRLLFH